jgi:hypothetical protein
VNSLRSVWRWLYWAVRFSVVAVCLVGGVLYTLVGIDWAIAPGRDPNVFTYPYPLLVWLVMMVGGPVLAFFCAGGIRALWSKRPFFEV